MNKNTELDQVEDLRSFNRFYTTQNGVLGEGLLDSKFPLSEARVIYELAACKTTTARELCDDLGLDAGYLSRLLRRLTSLGLMEKMTSHLGRRNNLLSLTKAGKSKFAVLAKTPTASNAKWLAPLSDDDRVPLIAAMEHIQTLLSPADNSRKTFALRPHRPGDMGQVISLHGRLYVEQFGWDHTFEALVARISADFNESFDPEIDCSWIAEFDGDFVGSASLVRVNDNSCKLRMMIIDPKVQGLGIGRALLNECLAFSRRKAYGKMTLWTNDPLMSVTNFTGFMKPAKAFGRLAV